MSFVPTPFTAVTPVTASELNANNDAFRKYINKDIIPADYAADTFVTSDILKGEYYNVVPDHQFTTGDMYTQNVLVDDNGGNRQYYSSTIKTALGDQNYAHGQGQWGITEQYQIIAETGKSIYFEANNSATINTNLAAKIIITGHIGARNTSQYVYNENNNPYDLSSTYTYAGLPIWTISPIETRFYLFYKVEGLTSGWQKFPDTKAQILGMEEYQNIVNSNLDLDETGLDRRVIPFLFQYDIPNLWAVGITPDRKPQTLAWSFALGVETTLDLGWVNNRIMTFEVFYA
tara:strand:+ start:2360 stop:3226 length:867 start_codon:yes stop_codon:yes gene_type:complete